MVAVYEFEVNLRSVQTVFFNKPDYDLEFDATSLEDTWTPVKLRLHNPKEPRANVFHSADTGSKKVMCVDQAARDVLADLVDGVGEFLPATLKKETVYFLNVTKCIDALDRDRVVWQWTKAQMEEEGFPPTVKEYAFLAEKIPRVPLFKMPYNRQTTIFVPEWTKDPRKEFKARVEQAGLTGFDFVKIWSDEPGEV